MQKTMYSILKDIDELSSQKEKVQALGQHQYKEALSIIANLALNPKVNWLLPEGNPPYKPCEFDAEGRFLSEIRRLYLFLEGGNNNLEQTKREQLFIDILESVDPDDAKLLLAMKDKKMPFKSINKTLIKKAFPNIW